MLQPATLKFLKDLSKNNHKEWFDANRGKYETAKADFLQLVEKIITDFCNKDKQIGALDAKRCLFRINRDIRFSKDKTPYKTNLGASFEKGGRISPFACYYLHIEPGNKSFIAGGFYSPEAPDLKKIRKEIEFFHDDLEEIVNEPNFKKQFGDLNRSESNSLKTAPKGFEKDHPAIEFLKDFPHNIFDMRDIWHTDVLQ